MKKFLIIIVAISVIGTGGFLAFKFLLPNMMKGRQPIQETQSDYSFQSSDEISFLDETFPEDSFLNESIEETENTQTKETVNVDAMLDSIIGKVSDDGVRVESPKEAIDRENETSEGTTKKRVTYSKDFMTMLSAVESWNITNLKLYNKYEEGGWTLLEEGSKESGIQTLKSLYDKTDKYEYEASGEEGSVYIVHKGNMFDEENLKETTITNKEEVSLSESSNLKLPEDFDYKNYYNKTLTWVDIEKIYEAYKDSCTFICGYDNTMNITYDELIQGTKKNKNYKVSILAPVDNGVILECVCLIYAESNGKMTNTGKSGEQKKLLKVEVEEETDKINLNDHNELTYKDMYPELWEDKFEYFIPETTTIAETAVSSNKVDGVSQTRTQSQTVNLIAGDRRISFNTPNAYVSKVMNNNRIQFTSSADKDKYFEVVVTLSDNIPQYMKIAKSQVKKLGDGIASQASSALSNKFATEISKYVYTLNANGTEIDYAIQAKITDKYSVAVLNVAPALDINQVMESIITGFQVALN